MRARWALITMEIPFCIREVDLKKKPKELLAISPKGTVPVLTTKEGKVIDESIEIIKWALNGNHNKAFLKGANQYSKTQIDKLIQQNDNNFKYHLDRYKYSYRYNINGTEKAIHRNKAKEILFEWNNLLKRNKLVKDKNWIVGESESIADWSIWPFVRQYYIADPMIFEEEKDLIFLKKWLHYFLEHSNFKILMRKRKIWANRNPD